jgi:uncharacterized integral membrane protein
MAFGPEGNDPVAGDSRAGVDKRRAVRLLVAGVAIVLAVLFMAQNNQRVELEFLMFSISTRLWVGMLVTLLLGALLGQAAETLWARRKRRNADA